MSVTLPIRFDYRANAGFVTDVSPNVFVTHSTAYAASPGYGWTSTVNTDSRDRNAALDARLAGIGFENSGDCDWKVDLPAAADYSITLAIGDAGSNQNNPVIELRDDGGGGAGLLYSFTRSSLGAEEFLDANDTLHTSAALWVSNQAARTFTFASSTLILRLKGTGAVSVVAHLRIDAVAAGGQPTSKRHGGVPFMSLPGRGKVWAPVRAPFMQVRLPLKRAA